MNDADTITDKHLDLIKKTVAKDATPEELELYLHDCKRRGVHPLDKLLYFMKVKNKYTPVTSIDFLRSRAEASGAYAGSDDAVIVYAEETGAIYSATTTVWKIVQGIRCPFTATARWSEYCPTNNPYMWTKMGHTMISKCSEALALRKGFSTQLAGLYTREEMDQAGVGTVVDAPKQETPPARLSERDKATPVTAKDNETVLEVRGMVKEQLDNLPEVPPAIVAEAEKVLGGGENKPPDLSNPISVPQRKRFFAIYSTARKKEPEVKEHLKNKYGITSTSHIQKEWYDELCKWASEDEAPF